MDRTNAERQARWRARRDAEIAELRKTVAALKAKLAKLEKAHPVLPRKDARISRSASA